MDIAEEIRRDAVAIQLPRTDVLVAGDVEVEERIGVGDLGHIPVNAGGSSAIPHRDTGVERVCFGVVDALLTNQRVSLCIVGW